jgi:hypothetical protein
LGILVHHAQKQLRHGSIPYLSLSVISYPFQGIKAAHEAGLTKYSRVGRGHTRSSSLQSVEEDPDAPEIAGQLLTPRETPQPEGDPSGPAVSDTLFSRIDAPLESDDSGTSRTRTAASGNALFTIADRSGIFDMEIIFCVCSDSDNIDEQLLRSRLFPSTFKQIETLFTFSVLDDFLTDNLECKTTAQQYYSKLQSMTSKMFLNDVPVCLSFMLPCTSTKWPQNRYKQLLRASRQWRDLKNRMESGIGHRPEEVSVPDGSMAIFCPACPQPGVNLPKDWKTMYTPYVISYHLDTSEIMTFPQ